LKKCSPYMMIVNVQKWDYKLTIGIKKVEEFYEKEVKQRFSI